MNDYIFMQQGNVYTLTEGSFQIHPQLGKGIYNLCISREKGLYLEKIAEEFGFNFKLYGVDNTLVKHVLDTYHNSESKSNIGVLLNGSKGTGKTVTAKLMANQLGLPVITISANYPGLNDFIAKMNQDCVFFFDEFEKNFRQRDDEGNSEAGQDLLSIMDGVYNCAGHSHIFLLTTNQLSINDNLISRPSRIRYIKSFGSVIDHKILEEYINDNLKYTEYKDELLEFIDSLEIATIDIVKSLVDEINIHKCSIEEFKPFFNVKESEYSYFVRGWNLEQEDTKDFDFSDYPEDYPYKKPYELKDFVNDCNEYERSRQRHRPWYETYRFTKPISKLKKGDTIGSKVIVKTLGEDNVIILKNPRDGRPTGGLTYIYVENPNAKPRLFGGKNGGNYDYGYNEY